MEIMEAEFFRKGRYHTHLLEESGWRKKLKPSTQEIALLCLKDHLERRFQPQSSTRSTWQESYALEA
jgi:hypothetical protein